MTEHNDAGHIYINTLTKQNLKTLKANFTGLNEEKKLELKNAFQSMIEGGIDVMSEDMYNDVQFFVSEFGLGNLPQYNTIIYKTWLAYQVSYPFSLRLTGDIFRVFPSTKGLISLQLGYIKDGIFTRQFHLFQDDDKSDNNILNFSYQELKQQEISNNQKLAHIQAEAQQNTQDLKNNMRQNNNNKQERISRQNHNEYIVKNGDTLWQLVKKHYHLTDNSDIANCINKLVEYNTQNNNTGLEKDTNGDSIKGDRVYVGQKLFLADELTFKGKKFLRNK